MIVQAWRWKALELCQWLLVFPSGGESIQALGFVFVFLFVCAPEELFTQVYCIVKTYQQPTIDSSVLNTLE